MRRSTFGVVCMAVVGVQSTVWAITSGQVDTFENGTLMNWAGGASLTNAATGGPGGVGDRHLRISSVGAGLATRNDVQWAGDYLATGVNGIAMDLLNAGNVDLSMRIVLFNSPGGDFTSTTAVPLPADNQWHRIVFGVTAADLAYVGGGTGILNDTLAAVSRLLVRHQPGSPTGAGTASPVTATLGIDNVSAVPEPATAITCAMVLMLVSRRSVTSRARRVMLRQRTTTGTGEK